MITLNNLENWIINYINLNKSSIIYIGVGTYCYNINKEIPDKKYWSYEENQQFPPFLHDFKSENLNIPILIILIDPAFDLNNISPYIVNSTDQFYANSWVLQQNKSEQNLFHSIMGIDVITLPDRILWGENFQKEPQNFNFQNLMINLSNFVSKSTVDTLLFYHEFTHSNVILLEHIVKKNTFNFNSNKICIDITKGSDMSCYFNLSSPEFYPIITIEKNNKLKYINPNVLSNDDKNKIIYQYKKFTDGFEDQNSDCNYFKFKPNYLFATEPNIILCFQIIKSDKIIYNEILTNLIPLLRYFYVCADNFNQNNKIYCDNYLTKFKSNINHKNISSILNQINYVEENLNLINSINLNIFDNHNYKDTVNYLKDNIIIELFDIIKNVLTDLLIKYNIDIIIINNFIENLKQLPNKYELIQSCKNFITNLNTSITL